MQYLITDIRTLAQTWVSAASAREALIAHENAWRKQPLGPKTKVSDYSQGDIIDVSLGESSIRGMRGNVVRQAPAITLFEYSRGWEVTTRQPLYAGEPIADFLAAQPNQPRKWLAARWGGVMIWQASDLDAETLADIRAAAAPYTDGMLAEDARQAALDEEG